MVEEQGKDQEPDIVCMPSSIKIFRLYGVFPPKGKLLNPGKMFYIKFALTATAASLILVGSTMHLIKNIKDKSFNHTELDLTYIVSMCAGYGLICSYFTKVNAAVHLYIGLSDFSKFGKPNNFDDTNKKYNKYSLIHYWYLQSIVLFILLGSNMFKGKSCKVENELKGINEVCGLFTYTWMPFNIDFFPVRQIYLLFQLFGADYVYMMAGLAAWMVLESVEHLATRIRHVSFLFHEALEEPNPVIQRQKFNFAVRYHVSVLSLEDNLNQTFSVFMFTHMVMSAAIMGYGVYAYMSSRNLSSFLLALGWLIGLFMDCRSGQRIQDESDAVRFALYSTNWLNCDISIRRDVLFVIRRCERQMVLRAASFGIMDHPMFLAVLKAAYSYITLMKQGENRNAAA